MYTIRLPPELGGGNISVSTTEEASLRDLKRDVVDSMQTMRSKPKTADSGESFCFRDDHGVVLNEDVEM